MKALIAALMFVSSLASAQQMLQARDHEGTSVTLSREACGNAAVLEVRERLNAQLEAKGVQLGDLRSAHVQYKGQAYEACWTQIGPNVVVIDDAGLPNSVFIVPVREFAPVDAV